jgi:hypothetical protein
MGVLSHVKGTVSACVTCLSTATAIPHVGARDLNIGRRRVKQIIDREAGWREHGRVLARVGG